MLKTAAFIFNKEKIEQKRQNISKSITKNTDIKKCELWQPVWFVKIQSKIVKKQIKQQLKTI